MSATIDNDKKVFYVGINPPTGNYNDLENKPAINGVELSSDTTLGDLGLSNVFDYKGQKPTYNDLPKSGNKKGDVWNVADTGENYAWSGSEWDCLTGTDVVNYVNGQLEALNQPITIDALKNEIINFSPNYTFKENWRNNSNVTTETFLSDVYADSSAAPGMTFIDELKCGDLPTGISTSTGQSIKLVNAEAVMEIMPCAISGVSKVIHVTITSGNVAPYRWELTYWVSGNTVNYSHWIAFQSELVAGNGINISFDNSTDKYVISSNADSLPPQAGNANKLLSTNGIDAYWMTKDYYQSLSSAQAIHLDDDLAEAAGTTTDGLYNGVEVLDGTIFVGDDGIAKKYNQESLGAGIEKTELSYSPTFSVENVLTIENGNSNILYGVISDYNSSGNHDVITKMYKSLNGGMSWTIIDSNRSYEGIPTGQELNQRIFYISGKHYIYSKIYDGGGGYRTYVDVSSDMSSWDRYTVSTNQNSPSPDSNLKAFIVDNYLYFDGFNSYNSRMIRVPIVNGDADLNNPVLLSTPGNQIRGDYVYPLNNILVVSGTDGYPYIPYYSDDYGANWYATTGIGWGGGPGFVKNNILYVQIDNQLYQTSNGTSFSLLGTYEDSNLHFEKFLTFENSSEIYAVNGSTVYYANTAEGLLKWTQVTTDFTPTIVVSPVILFNSPATIRGKYGVEYSRLLENLTYNVPIPTSADTNKYLKGDGTWSEVQGGSSASYDISSRTIIFS